MQKSIAYQNTLAGKLTLAIFFLMVAISGSSGLLFLSFERSVTMSNMDRQGKFMDELVKKSLYHDMMENRSDDMAQAVMTFAESPDIEKIHIYDLDGVVAFSGSPEEVGNKVKGVSIDDILRNEDEAFSQLGRTSTGKQYLNYYSPIKAHTECLNAFCHYHPMDSKVLGIMYTSFDVTNIKTTNRQILLVICLVGAFMVGMISLFLFFVIHRFVTNPIALLEAGMIRIAAGDFEHTIELQARDEMGRLAMNFNIMSKDIQRYKNRLENWAIELQKEVEKKTVEIKETQEQLANAEKLASLGRMSAGVAHELNNPLTGIVTFAHLMLERTPEENVIDREDLELIIEQADRCTKIIKGLLSFSRKGASEKSAISMNDLLKNAVSFGENGVDPIRFTDIDEMSFGPVQGIFN